MNKLKSRNNILLIIYALFAFLIVFTSFGNGIMNYFIMIISYLLVNASNDISALSVIIEYILIGLIYISLGILSFYLFLSCFNELKYVIIYSMIVNIALIVVSMIIKSFYGLDVIKFLIKMFFCMVGILLALVIEFLKVRFKNK